MEARPLERRATAATVLLALTIAAAALSLWADLDQHDVISRMADDQRVPLGEIEDADDRVGWTAALYTVVIVLSALTFLLWYSRAYRNVIALRLNPRFSPGWAVAAWFIPILNVFRPKQVMNDIWRASDPQPPQPGEPLGRRPVSALLHWWWALWLLDTFLSRIAFRNGFEDGDFASDLDSLKSEAAGYVAVDIADIVAGILAILVVRRITARVVALPAGDAPVFEADRRRAQDPPGGDAATAPVDASSIYCPRCGHALPTAYGSCPGCRMETQPAGGPIADPSQSSDARKQARRAQTRDG